MMIRLMIYSAIAVLGLLGVIGNIVSIVIWTRPQLKSSSSVFLTTLAVCDLIMLITTNTMGFLNMLYYHKYFSDSPFVAYVVNVINPHITVWFFPLALTIQTASIYLTLAITLERFLAVCHPFKARTVCTPERAIKFVMAIITFSFLYNLIGFFRYSATPTLVINGHTISYNVSDSQLSRSSSLYQSIYVPYDTWLRLILIFLIPLICIAVLNTRICFEVKRLGERQQSLTNTQRKERSVTKMLVFIVAEFLVCSSVDVLFTAVRILNLPYKQPRFNLMNLLPLNLFFVTFNSSSNILTYLVLGSGFRKVFLNTFGCCRVTCRRRDPQRTDNRELEVRTSDVSTSSPTTDFQVISLE